MRVFVAGATGVLGQPSVKRLIAAGHEVRGAARSEDKAALLRSLGATPVTTDLFDAASVREAVAGCDAVVHLATKIPSLTKMRSKGAWKENDRLRRDATRNLVDAALATKAQAFVMESITFVYANGGESWLSEDSPINLVWSPLESAMDAEKETKRFADGGGRGVVLRFGLFYAPYAASTIDTMKMARRKMFGIIGRGENYFSSIHVDDAAAAVAAAVNAPGGTYNVVEDEPVSQEGYAQAMYDAFGLGKPRHFPKWLGKLVLGGPSKYILQSQRVSNKRFKEATGWSPQHHDVREGMRSVTASMPGKKA
jgi:nucleoside-diphosphate-sugar epimerase